MKKTLFTLLILLISLVGFGQLHYHNDHKEHEHYHIESKIGFGAAGALIYDVTEKEFAPGFHIHALKIFNEKVGAGFGYEGVLGPNYHQTLTLFGKIFLADYLSINIGPGLTLPNKEHNEFALSGHIEIATAFDIWDLHVGPMMGYGVSADDSHISLGMHVGWHF